MKFKHLFSAVGLGLFAAASIGVGALAKNYEPAEVKATGEKWMVTICFDNTVPETSGVWGFVDNRKVNFWGTNVTYDESVQSFHNTKRDYFYAVNVVFEGDQKVSGMQINFTENGVKKESQDITIALDSSCNGLVYTYSFPEEVSWVSGKWSYDDHGSCVPSARFNQTDKPSVDKVFTPDPETTSYYIKDVNIDLSEGAIYAKFCPFSYSLFEYDDTYNSIREEASYYEEYFYGWYGPAWIEFKVSGTFDFFLTNEFKEGGVIDVKKHDATDTYIYYVTNSASATGDYIYSWGGSEQFGSFPGTSIASLVAAEKAEEVTRNGVLHFQGGETAKLIYKINITKGYPTGDTMFMFDNGTDDYKSAERSIEAEHAYWWEGPANHDAAQGLQFILTLEMYRHQNEGYSVCDINKGNAEFIVNNYLGFDANIRRTYIDCSTIYTYADASRKDNKLWTVREIVEQLGKIAEIPVPETPSETARNYKLESNQIVLITIIAISSVCFASLAVLLIVKKKKHN